MPCSALSLLPAPLLGPWPAPLEPPAQVLPVLGKLRAGFPSPATDYLDEGLDINDYLVAHPAATFFFTVQGDSMEGAGILGGDKVVVDRSVTPRSGHIVVALVEQQFTLKRLFVRPGRLELRADNPAYAPIVLRPDADLEIWGVVVGVVRKVAL